MEMHNIPVDLQQRLHALQVRLDHQFVQPALLLEALTHRSYAFEQGRGPLRDNEILEFIGDAVLDLALGNALVSRYRDRREGELSKMRAGLVNEAHLALMARGLELGGYLLLGRGEEMSGGRDKASILACAYEALIGALFRDGGYDRAARFIEGQFSPWYTMHLGAVLQGDAKSRLQELCQAREGEVPQYLLEREEGPGHEKLFTVAVYFKGRRLAEGVARNKKEAEQQAASRALEGMECGGAAEGRDG